MWLKLPRVNFRLHHQVRPFWAAQLKKQNTHTSRCNFNTVFSASEAEELIKFNCSSLLDAVDLTTSTCQTRTIISLSKIVQTLHSIKEKEIKSQVILVAFAIFSLVMSYKCLTTWQSKSFLLTKLCYARLSGNLFRSFIVFYRSV